MCYCSVSDLGDCQNEYTKADVDDCHYYLQCAEGHLYRYYCGEESVFDPTSKTCMSPVIATSAKCSNNNRTKEDISKNEYIRTSHKYNRSNQNIHLPGKRIFMQLISKLIIQ